MPASNRPTLVLLVRHGATPTTGTELYGRRDGVELSDAGIQQAQNAGQRIAALSKHIAAVYTSPLLRAQQTADHIAKAIGKQVKIHEGLNELDVGKWTGRKLAALYKLKAWRTVQRYPSGFRFPSGESFSEMQIRFVSAVSEIAERHSGKTVVTVAHADPIRAFIAHAMGTHLDLFQRIVVSPCSVTAVSLGSGGPIVLTTNSTSDLTELKPA